jgi:hypothetical protein
MQTGIENIKDLAELISYVIASVSLIGIWIAYAHSKKQIHFSAMDKFVKDFRDFQISGSDLEDERAFEYIELVNEEFFYMENGYLPIEVCIEWIDGMIDYLPFYDKHNNFISRSNLSVLKEEDYANNLLYLYPRVFKAIKLDKKIDFDKIYLGTIKKENRKIREKERNDLIYLIITNLKVGFRTKFLLKRKIASR